MKHHPPARILASGVALGLVLFTTGALADSGMQVLERWKIGGGGGWDYLTADASHRLFLSRGTQVDVVDTKAGKVIGTIPDTQGVHGIALAPDLHRGFTSNGRADSVTAFDLDTLKTIQEMKVPGHNPDSILYEPKGKHVFTFNGRSKDVTVLDATTLAVVATLAVPDKPEFSQDDHAGHIFGHPLTFGAHLPIHSGMRLLLTEDDAELAQSLIERFRDQGYEVVHVGDGIQGLKQATDQDFDAIIVDRMLPGHGRPGTGQGRAPPQGDAHHLPHHHERHRRSGPRAWRPAAMTT